MSLEPSFWNLEEVPEPKALTRLRAIVLERSEKRMPIWRFRLSDQIVFQVQPKPTIFRPQGEEIWRSSGSKQEISAFEWRTTYLVEPRCDEDFKTPLKKLATPGVAVSGRLHSRLGEDGSEIFECKATGCYSNLQFPDEREECWRGIRKGVFDLFRDGRFDGLYPETMFSPNCLICGKALTDPASMARFIGPECYGSSSLSVPRMLDVPVLVLEP